MPIHLDDVFWEGSTPEIEASFYDSITGDAVAPTTLNVRYTDGKGNVIFPDTPVPPAQTATVTLPPLQVDDDDIFRVLTWSGTYDSATQSNKLFLLQMSFNIYQQVGP